MNTHPETWTDEELDNFLINHFREYTSEDQEIIRSLGIIAGQTNRKKLKEMMKDRTKLEALPAADA